MRCEVKIARRVNCTGRGEGEGAESRFLQGMLRSETGKLERERDRENFIGNLIGLVVNSFRCNFSKIPATFNDVPSFSPTSLSLNEGNWIKPVLQLFLFKRDIPTDSGISNSLRVSRVNLVAR